MLDSLAHVPLSQVSIGFASQLGSARGSASAVEVGEVRHQVLGHLVLHGHIFASSLLLYELVHDLVLLLDRQVSSPSLLPQPSWCSLESGSCCKFFAAQALRDGELTRLPQN